MCFFICFHRFTSNDRDEAKRNRGSFGVKRRYNYLVEIQKSPGEFTLRGLFYALEFVGMQDMTELKRGEIEVHLV